MDTHISWKQAILPKIPTHISLNRGHFDLANTPTNMSEALNSWRNKATSSSIDISHTLQISLSISSSSICCSSSELDLAFSGLTIWISPLRMPKSQCLLETVLVMQSPGHRRLLCHPDLAPLSAGCSPWLGHLYCGSSIGSQ